MSRFISPSCVVLVAALWLSSCSIFRPHRDISSPEIQVETPAEVIDSVAIAKAAKAAAEAVDTLSQDSVVVVESPIEEIEEEPADELDLLFFDESQTKGVVLAEYKNLIIDDLAIDLQAENSCYPADGHLTSPYGWRHRRMHAGLDIKAQTGDNLYAAFDGVVRLAKYYSSFGNCIIIRHHNGLETLYAHASKLLVKVNDHVKAGDVIALAGSTGRSTGSHLHFETRVGGHYFNPNLILDTDKRKIKDATLYITMRNGRLFASNNDSAQERNDYITEQLSIKYHIVRSGDMLSRIAANNGTTVATICRLNGIKSTSILRIGQRLIVRDGIKPSKTSKITAVAATTSSTSATAKASSNSSTASASNTSIYTVKRGDTLGAIAQRNGTTVTKICQLNNITSRTTLQIGQRLKLSGSAAAASSEVTASSQYHTVRSGDTLGAIAMRYGTTVTKLCRLNGISSRSILNLNQRIRVN